MKDIKSLYLAAKVSGNENDISAYSESLQTLLENNPIDYVSNLEYIITSDIGLRTLTEFVEKHGLPICCYDNVMEVLEKCISKCEMSKKDPKEYQEAINYMEAFRQKYIGCFMMESYFSESISDDYVSIYYGKNSNGYQNRKLAAGLLYRFGEGAIPDILITADSIGESAINTVLEYIQSSVMLNKPIVYEWVLESTKNLVPESNAVRSLIAENALSPIVRNVQKRSYQAYREAAMSGEDYVPTVYSESEIDAIKDMISFEEYKLTWADEINESAIEIQNRILSLYEEFDNLLDENGDPLEETFADNIAPMLPGVRHLEELVNTTNKKTGNIPSYLGRNHNLNYGEDDINTKSYKDEIPSLDDYRRPSAMNKDPEPYTNVDNEEDDTDDDEHRKLTPAEQQAVNNYYYYTYNNSLNKTKDSYNSDRSSHRDDHSIHTNNNNRSDDHSSGKNINSHNNSSEDSYDTLKEKTIPWELNIFNDQLFSENKSNNSLGITEAFNEDLYITESEIKFYYTYRTVKASDGDFYLITFDIDGPGVVNYKLHYPDATKNTVKFVGRISGNYLKRYGNDNYVSKGNRILKIKNIRTNKEVQSVTASGAVPAEGENIDSIGSTSITYTVGEPSPLSYKSTIPIYPLAGTVATPFGSMKGLNFSTSPSDVLNPFKSRRIDFSKPILYKERYSSLAVILKPALMGYEHNIKSYKNTSLNDIEKELHQKIKSNPLYKDYLIAPLDISEYNNILLMSSIFIRNCAKNLNNEPWSNIPNVYQGLLIGFFGPPIGGKKYVNINIIEPITSNRYKVNTNVFQNISDWFTLIANGLAQIFGVEKQKRNSYFSQHEEIKIFIRDTFYRKDISSIYETGGFITEGILDKVKNIFSRRKNSPSIPATKEVYTFQYLPLNDKDKQVIIGKIRKLKEQMEQRLEPIFSKYPIYGLHVHMDEDDINSCFEVIRDDPNSPGTTITVPGITVSNGNVELEITPEVVGSNQYKFMEELERNHPDEIKRLSVSYDMTKRYDWMCIHWGEKICGYDKDLTEITTDIEQIIISEFKMIRDYGFYGDNDSGPCYDGKVDGKYLLPEFDSSKLETATWTWIPKSFATMATPEKHFFGIRHDHQFSESVYAEKVGDADDDRPESDHPIKDTLTDIDRVLVSKHQDVKRKVQNVQNAGRIFVKPAVRTKQWITNMISNWKDLDETKAKERMADPHARSKLFSAVKVAIAGGSLLKAGLLLNPVFLVLGITRGATKHSRDFRLRNEMIAELKTEIEIVKTKVQDADRAGDNKAKYQLMRLQNEIQKKLLRVGGDRSWKKII